MRLFEFREGEVLTTQFRREAFASADPFRDPAYPTRLPTDGRKVFQFNTPEGVRSDAGGLDNQFIIFQLSGRPEGPAILESSEVISSIEGSPELPDVLVQLELQSFHLGREVTVDPDTRATMRINIGKDENSTDRLFDTTFWSIAAGLDLYHGIQEGRVEPKAFRSDFRQAFGNRPIEIPGGLAKMTFEVVRHREPRWWQRIFGFLRSETGHDLISTLGFPAISSQAIRLLDELLNKLDRSEPELLFQSRPLRLALTQKARQDYTGGNSRVQVGSLSPGFCILARAADFPVFVQADARYFPTYGKLVPTGVPRAKFLRGAYEDPFRDVTYAVFRVGMKSHRLDPQFQY